MPLLDVSRVTSTLVNLLDAHINESPAWPSSVTLSVTPDPPDLLEGNASLGVYLYHVTEDPYRRNVAVDGGNGDPVRFAPMGLSLHYQVTPHSDLENGGGALREQLMMGCALKAFHDFPVVDDETEVAGAPVMDPVLVGGGNRLRVVLQSVPYGESTSFWAAGSKPPRLAAYYEVSVVLLEPDEPPSRAGRVLRYGVFALAADAPHLDGSSSTLTFTAPGGSAPSELEARPAQVPVGGELVLEGSALTGDATALVLRSARWDDSVAPDPGAVAWNVRATPTRVDATVRATAGSEDVLPGVYAASIAVRRRKVLPNGLTRDFDHRSNETPFVVVPAITAVSITPAGRVTVDGGRFAHPDLVPEDVEVYVGETRLALHAPPPAQPPAGTFLIVNPTRIRFQLPAGLASGSQQALRIVVDRAESPPRWLVVP